MVAAPHWINNFKQILNKTFKMTDLGPCRYYLGMQITQDWRLGTIHLDQTEYVKQILQAFQMTDCKPASTPMEQKLALPPLDQDPSNTKLRL